MNQLHAPIDVVTSHADWSLFALSVPEFLFLEDYVGELVLSVKWRRVARHEIIALLFAQ